MSNYLNILVYGLPGSGKTWFSASFGKLERFQPTLYIDCFANTISLSSWDNFHPTYLRPQSLADLQGILTLLSNPAKFMQSELGKQMGSYPKLVVVDTLSELQNIIIDHAKGSSNQMLKHKALRIQDYGVVKDITLSFVRRLNRCPTHIIYTGWSSHVHASTDSRPSPLTVQLVGSSRDLLMAFVNYAGYIAKLDELPHNIRRMYGIDQAANDTRVVICDSSSFSRGKNQLSHHKFLLNPDAETFLKQLGSST